MTQQQTETGKTTAEFIESLGCPVEASVETTCGPLKLVKSPEEELFGRPVEVAVDHRLEIARELERVTGYRWGRWQSSSGETKLHLTGSTKPETPTFVTACGNIVFRPYCESLTLTYNGERCKRCMAIDGVAFAADLARREAEHAISDAAWWRRTRPSRPYEIDYRAPDAWCVGSRWRPLTGGLNAPPPPTRFRDVCGGDE